MNQEAAEGGQGRWAVRPDETTEHTTCRNAIFYYKEATGANGICAKYVKYL
jgi:hypothetical protein